MDARKIVIRVGFGLCGLIILYSIVSEIIPPLTTSVKKFFAASSSQKNPEKQTPTEKKDPLPVTVARIEPPATDAKKDEAEVRLKTAPVDTQDVQKQATDFLNNVLEPDQIEKPAKAEAKKDALPIQNTPVQTNNTTLTIVQTNTSPVVQQTPEVKTDPPKPSTPVFQNGVSKLYGPKDIQKLINMDVKDAWLSGKFTIKSGGPSVPTQMACFEAGTQTKLVWDALLKKPSSASSTPFYIFGWYFNENKHGDFKKFKEGTVFIISESSPAKIEKVYYFEGHPALLAMLVNPPVEEE